MIPKENQQTIFKRFDPLPATKVLKIIHFNDVYNIEGSTKEPTGGAARFLTAIDYLNRNNDCLVAFSGDAFSPSTLSIFAKGQQMVECLNCFNIHAAAIDMGMDKAIKLVNKSRFPWLLSNVFCAEDKKPLFNYEIQTVVQINDVKVGLFALAEKEWVSSLSAIQFDDIYYESFIETARKISRQLKENEKCDIVIALTHMRWRNDEKLANKVPEIDIILGGHDHEYETKKINDMWIIKSGSDFKELSYIELQLEVDIDPNGNKKFKWIPESITKIKIDSKIKENEKIKRIVDHYQNQAEKDLDEELGVINADLDGRYDKIRTSETNLGNFFCDIVLCNLLADCAILNGGSFRSDKLHPAGAFTKRDLRSILAFDSELVTLKVTGSELHQVLEHGVSKYHDKGGRYPQVSGIFYAFDPTKEPNKRIDSRIVKIQGEYLDLNKTYTLATNTFMRNVDETLKNCPVVVHSENIPPLYLIIENFFKQINSSLQEYDQSSRKYQSPIIPRVVLSSLITNLSKDPEVLPPKAFVCQKQQSKLSFRMAALIVQKTLRKRDVVLYKDKVIIKESEKYKQKMSEYISQTLKMKPKIEGRSVLIDDEVLQQLLNERG